MLNNAKVSLSIVSHNQDDLVKTLLADLDALSDLHQYVKEVIVVCNITRNKDFKLSTLPLKVIFNSKPKGFGENHNMAFQHSSGEFFCVVNPDIRLKSNPFSSMLDTIDEDNVGVVLPLVFASNGCLEDSIRRFPTFSLFISKLFGSHKYRYRVTDYKKAFTVDWGAGMFMLFRRKTYEQLKGFDEKFFLYYEDVDICTRIWILQQKVIVCPTAKVIHDAQRSSHSSLKYLLWHLSSFLKYQSRYIFRYPNINKAQLGNNRG